MMLLANKFARPCYLASASLAAVALSAPAVAQDGSGTTNGSPSSRDAAISALQHHLDQTEAELIELRQELAALRGGTTSPADQSASTSATPQSPTPTSPGSPSKPSLGGLRVGTQASLAARSTNPSTPTTGSSAHIESGHPIISTDDGRFTANITGVMQFDVADYFQHSAGPASTDFRRSAAASGTPLVADARARDLANGTNFRRARIGIGGRAFGDFEYNVLFEFGGAGIEDSGHIQELWLQYSGFKPAHIRAGAFPPFIGLEDAGSTNGMLFLERPASADIARSLAGGDYREAGQIAFTGKRWFASGALTGRLVNVNTSNSTQVQPYNSQLGLISRGVVLPVRDEENLVLAGIHGSYVVHPADAGGPDAKSNHPIQLRERPELRVDGTRLIDTGAIDSSHAFTAGAEVAAQHNNFFIQGEYERIGIDRRDSPLANPRFSGFYVEGSWILTGEKRRFNEGNFAFDGPTVKGSFNPARGNWGVWELALRYSDINLNYHAGDRGTALPTDGIRGGHQKIAAAGVNWYLNPIARIMFDYQHVEIDRLSPSASAYLTPVGAEIGQKYSTGEARFQLAF